MGTILSSPIFQKENTSKFNWNNFCFPITHAQIEKKSHLILHPSGVIILIVCICQRRRSSWIDYFMDKSGKIWREWHISDSLLHPEANYPLGKISTCLRAPKLGTAPNHVRLLCLLDQLGLWPARPGGSAFFIPWPGGRFHSIPHKLHFFFFCFRLRGCSGHRPTIVILCLHPGWWWK